MSLRIETLISGFGGQGVVLAGRTLGLTAVYSSLSATMLVSHGTETRGGYVRSQVVISDEPIDSPVVERSDIFLALSQAAYLRFKHMAEGGLIIYEADLVKSESLSARQIALPAVRLSVEATGQELSANMVALGQIIKLLPIVPLAAAIRAVEKLSKRGRDNNLKALELGYSLDLEAANLVSQK